MSLFLGTALFQTFGTILGISFTLHELDNSFDFKNKNKNKKIKEEKMPVFLLKILQKLLIFHTACQDRIAQFVK